MSTLLDRPALFHKILGLAPFWEAANLALASPLCFLLARSLPSLVVRTYREFDIFQPPSCLPTETPGVFECLPDLAQLFAAFPAVRRLHVDVLSVLLPPVVARHHLITLPEQTIVLSGNKFGRFCTALCSLNASELIPSAAVAGFFALTPVSGAPTCPTSAQFRRQVRRRYHADPFFSVSVRVARNDTIDTVVTLPELDKLLPVRARPIAVEHAAVVPVQPREEIADAFLLAQFASRPIADVEADQAGHTMGNSRQRHTTIDLFASDVFIAANTAANAGSISLVPPAIVDAYRRAAGVIAVDAPAITPLEVSDALQVLDGDADAGATASVPNRLVVSTVKLTLDTLVPVGAHPGSVSGLVGGLTGLMRLVHAGAFARLPEEVLAALAALEGGRSSALAMGHQHYVFPAFPFPEAVSPQFSLYACRPAWTALAVAAGTCRSLDAVRRLMPYEARRRSATGHTALMAAAAYGFADAAALLIPSEARMTTSRGLTALMVACIQRHYDFIELLLPHEAGMTTDEGHSALLLLLMHAHHSVVRPQAAPGAAAPADSAVEDSQRFHRAVAALLPLEGRLRHQYGFLPGICVYELGLYEHYSAAETLFTMDELGDELRRFDDHFDRARCSASMLQAQSERLVRFRSLGKENSFWFRALLKHPSALHMAVANRDLYLAQRLFDAGVPFPNITPTLLYLAADCADTRFVELVGRHAPPSLKVHVEDGYVEATSTAFSGRRNETALMRAAYFGNLAAVRLLLHREAGIANSNGVTALFRAVDGYAEYLSRGHAAPTVARSAEDYAAIFKLLVPREGFRTILGESAYYYARRVFQLPPIPELEPTKAHGGPRYVEGTVSIVEAEALEARRQAWKGPPPATRVRKAGRAHKRPNLNLLDDDDLEVY
jgi:hypothetical protein